MEEAQGSGPRNMSLRVLGSNTSARLLYEVGANQILQRVTGFLIAASLPVTQLGRANRVNATSGRRHPREPEVLHERSSVHLQHG